MSGWQQAKNTHTHTHAKTQYGASVYCQMEIPTERVPKINEKTAPQQDPFSNMPMETAWVYRARFACTSYPRRVVRHFWARSFWGVGFDFGHCLYGYLHFPVTMLYLIDCLFVIWFTGFVFQKNAKITKNESTGGRRRVFPAKNGLQKCKECETWQLIRLAIKLLQESTWESKSEVSAVLNSLIELRCRCFRFPLWHTAESYHFHVYVLFCTERVTYQELPQNNAKCNKKGLSNKRARFARPFCRPFLLHFALFWGNSW